MIKGYCKKHHNNECLAIAMMLSCFQQIFEKNLEFTAEGWVFSLFCELTAFWLLIFVSTEPSRSILLIDRSESRFESHAGGKITKTLKKR